MPPFSTRDLDRWFPTIVRYTGLGLVVALVVGGILGVDATTIASGGVLASGMILYKTVQQAARGGTDGDDDRK